MDRLHRRLSFDIDSILHRYPTSNDPFPPTESIRHARRDVIGRLGITDGRSHAPAPALVDRPITSISVDAGSPSTVCSAISPILAVDDMTLWRSPPLQPTSSVVDHGSSVSGMTNCSLTSPDSTTTSLPGQCLPLPLACGRLRVWNDQMASKLSRWRRSPILVDCSSFVFNDFPVAESFLQTGVTSPSFVVDDCRVPPPVISTCTHRQQNSQRGQLDRFPSSPSGGHGDDEPRQLSPAFTSTNARPKFAGIVENGLQIIYNMF